MKPILIVAHAGSMNTPDDSLDSVKIGIELKADIVEIDIRFNADNIPVLCHDRLKKDQYYETVYDAIALLAQTNDIHLNCDMKEMTSPKGLGNLKEIVEHFNFKDRMYFSGIKNAKAKLLQKTFPGYKFVTDWTLSMPRIGSKEYIESIVRLAKASGFMGLNLNYRFVTKMMIDICHEYDIKMYTWTVGEAADIRRLAEWGVDAITSRNPALVWDVVIDKNYLM